MSIIYSYPEQGVLNADDMLIGTSAQKVGGKQKNLTKNFTIQQVADFINGGLGLIDPVAADFQIPVFNQLGKKITGSIMSQDSSPSNGVAGTGITVTGNLTATGNLLVSGSTTLGGAPGTTISLLGQTTISGAVRDVNQALSAGNQILLSNGNSQVVWTDYSAGLTYQGVWNANTNTPTLVSGTGTNGHFYIVDVAGNTILNGNTDWQVGDWALFSGVTGAGGFWDKIDNTQSLTGSGTTNTITMWTSPSAIGDSLISQAGTVVSVNASLKVKDTVEATTTNANLKLKGAGTGGVEVMGDTASTTDGKIQLNCYVNTHGVTIQSPPHSDSATYTLILPSTVGTVNQVLTSAGAGAGAQLTWSTPTTGTVTSINYTTDFTAFTAGPGAAITTAGTFTLNKNGGTAGQYIDGAAGAWTNLPVTGVTSVSSAVTAIPGLTLVTTNPNTTPVITLGLAATAGSGEYLDGGTGQWTTLPVTGVTSVSGTANRISVTGGNTAVVNAVTGTVNSSSVTLATGQQIQAAIDLALSGALVFKGTFNAATGAIDGGSTFLYQVTAGGAFDSSAARVAVSVGDFYIANVAGNFYGTGGTAMGVGDEAIATTAYAANASVLAGWSVVPTQSSGGTVTSVGYTTDMPAFVVGGQPITSSGVLTLNKTGGTAGQFLKQDGNWADVPAGYSPWLLNGQSGTAQSIGSGETVTITSANTAITTSVAATNTLTLTSTVYGGAATIGHVPTGGSNTTFLRGDGSWAAAGGLPVKTVVNLTGTGQSSIALGITPSSTAYVDLYVDGVYQNKNTYAVSGVNLTLTSPAVFPTGVSIEAVTTT